MAMMSLMNHRPLNLLMLPILVSMRIIPMDSLLLIHIILIKSGILIIQLVGTLPQAARLKKSQLAQIPMPLDAIQLNTLIVQITLIW